MALDKQTLKMHADALEGAIFADNLLNKGEHARKYFPPIIGQDMSLWKQSPKVAFPLVGDVIRRMTSLLHQGLEIKVVQGSKAHEEALEEVLVDIKWDVIGRQLFEFCQGGGNYLAIIRTGWESISLDLWKGEWIINDSWMNYPVLGYAYVQDRTDPSLMHPVVKKLNEEELKRLVQVWVDDMFFVYEKGGIIQDVHEHNMGFCPAELFMGIDKLEGGRYGKPMYKRAGENGDLIVEYNQTYSQVAKAVKIFQNVWATDKDVENPDYPLSIIPDYLNFLGKDGKLWQLVRELKIEPEVILMDKLQNHLSTNFQIPEFFTGLNSSVGKFPSGVAMMLQAQPLTELMTRARGDFKTSAISLLTKCVAVKIMMKGGSPGNFQLGMKMDETVVPVDVELEIKNLVTAKKEGLIADEYMPAAQARTAQLLKLTTDTEGIDRDDLQ